MSKIFGYSSKPDWKNWEISALAFTLFYTAFIYYEGRRKKYFESLTGTQGILIGAALMSLLVVLLISANESTHIFSYTVDRRGSMVCLVVTTLLFVILDFTMYKSLARSLPQVSRAYFLSLKFSDVPILIAFVVLSIYAFVLGSDNIDHLHMDAFFGGTVAFQMMLSNIVWTLTDDVFVEHTSK